MDLICEVIELQLLAQSECLEMMRKCEYSFMVPLKIHRWFINILETIDPLSEPMLTQFTDAYMRHSGKMR